MTPPADNSVIDIQASKDSTHPHFHFNLGKVLSSVVLGLEVWGAESQATNAQTFLSNPQNLSNIVSGFSSIWVTK